MKAQSATVLGSVIGGALVVLASLALAGAGSRPRQR